MSIQKLIYVNLNIYLLFKIAMNTDKNKVAERFLFKSNLVYSGLPSKVKDAFFEQITERQYKKGQNIFTEGTFPAGIFFIKKGKIKKYKMLNEGREQIIYICCEGELLGYTALLCEEPYPDSASTLTDATIGFIPKEKLLALIDKHIELSKMLLKNLSHEFGVLVNIITTFTQKTVRERVAFTLLILEEKFKDTVNENNEIQIILTREDFANIVGTAVETLVRLLRDFKDENLITTQGRKISITNRQKLLEIANLADSF
jgi:CRP-like cAMP-binding protein